MIRLSTLLLAPPVGERLRARYDDYRQHGASWLSASLGCLWASLVWALMPLETPRWQAILAHHDTYFPHINPHRPRPPASIRSCARVTCSVRSHQAAAQRWPPTSAQGRRCNGFRHC